VSTSPLSFLGGVDPKTGMILDPESDAKGECISKRVLCFPYGKGSTVGSYSMYQLRLNGLAPTAIVNSSAEPIVATGAIMSEIPMIDGVDISLLRAGDHLDVDAGEGVVEVKDLTEKHVVTTVLRSKGKILLLRRSSKVGSFRGRWAGVSGFIEPHEPDEDAARRELQEEVSVTKARLVRRIEPERFRDGKTVWCVHPFLFDVKDPSVKLDWEHEAFEWTAPQDIGRFETVPGLPMIVRKLLGP
jgi:predicted aconitase with swiveling domain